VIIATSLRSDQLCEGQTISHAIASGNGPENAYAIPPFDQELVASPSSGQRSNHTAYSAKSATPEQNYQAQ
jgi:hypothetical protein